MKNQSKNTRSDFLEINPQEFSKAGHKLIDDIISFTEDIPNKPITKAETVGVLRDALSLRPLPEEGTALPELMANTTDLLIDHSLFNGHPGFMGYITASAAPSGALADLLAATINPNCGAGILSPMATEIENQTIQWLAELIGYNSDAGGVLVSGGNMANFTGFLAGRTAKAPVDLKEKGLAGLEKPMTVYCSKGTHTWIEKAAILFGHGSEAVRWIPQNEHHQMDNEKLESAIISDIDAGFQPFMVVGTAGDVSTGKVDDLSGISKLSKKYDLWFHVDGAYGVPAAALPELNETFKGLESADSIALDPHKWLYCPLEAGGVLVKNRQDLINAFSSHPEYYNFDAGPDQPSVNFYEYGLQNSRGFRALKVWIALQQAGRSGYQTLIREDIQLSELLFDLADNHSELEAVTQSLSITTFRYLPENIPTDSELGIKYLNELNETLLNEIASDGEIFVSNAIIDGNYCLRSCIVNFRTNQQTIHDLIKIVVQKGRELHKSLCNDHGF